MPRWVEKEKMVVQSIRRPLDPPLIIRALEASTVFVFFFFFFFFTYGVGCQGDEGQ